MNIRELKGLSDYKKFLIAMGFRLHDMDLTMNGKITELTLANFDYQTYFKDILSGKVSRETHPTVYDYVMDKYLELDCRVSKELFECNFIVRNEYNATTFPSLEDGYMENMECIDEDWTPDQPSYSTLLRHLKSLRDITQE